jgi:rare lipoprotein A
MPVAAPVVAAALGVPPALEPRLVGKVPMPPERPFDLGTIPSAATPVPGPGRIAHVLPPVRPAYAGLFYADPDVKRSRAGKHDPFDDLAPRKSVALRRTASDVGAH